jgi:putative transposase
MPFEWPHAPAHRLTLRGTYIVTGGTYGKAPLFSSRKRLNILCCTLLDICATEKWDLQAWCAFPNHYHFVGTSEHPESLPRLVSVLHSLTAHAVNRLDGTPDRRVWYQYWDSLISNQRSYFARLRYVHENAVRHGIVRRATNYPWCSAGWFERVSRPAFRKTVLEFPCDRVRVPDPFPVSFKLEG